MRLASSKNDNKIILGFGLELGRKPFYY